MIMEKKINIAELLKDCPKGMELDCTLYEDVYFDGITEDPSFPIAVNIQCDGETWTKNITLTNEGKLGKHPNAKCVIFPKGKTTWEGFVPPCKFNAGDVLVSEYGNIVLLSHIDTENFVHYHCIIPTYGSFRIEENTGIGVGRYYECVLANEQQKQRMYDKIKSSGYKYNQNTNELEKLIEPEFNDGNIVVTTLDNIALISNKNNDDGYKCHCLCIGNNLIVEKLTIYPSRLATEEEKQELFDTIEENGYKWNAETKTLENLVKPIFNIGDKIKKKNCRDNRLRTIESINNNYYIIKTPNWFDNCYITDKLSFNYQNEYELVHANKFDITTLKHFDKVLVRDTNEQEWSISFFGYCTELKTYKYSCINDIGWAQCIPYEENKHLAGTTNDCDDYYKTW